MSNQPLTDADNASDLTDRIVEMVSRLGTVSGLAPSDDFYEAGFASIHALPLLMELEDAFGVSIPDEDFVAARSCAALNAIVVRLRSGASK